MHKRILYALAGLAYGLLFHARINIAVLAAFVVLPYLFFRILLRRDAPEEDPSDSRFRRICRRFAPWKESVPSLLALGLPVAAAIGAAMVLNLLRFDNPFEFGTSYQFTVSDIRYNHLSFADLFPAIYHYFFQPLNLSSGIFPYLSLQKIVLNNYGHYVYVDTGMGLFSIPLMWSLFGGIFVFANKKRSLAHKVTLAFLFVGSVAVAWFDFCLGGVIFRYTCDLTLLLAFAAMAIVFSLSEETVECGESRGGNITLALLLAVSLLVSVSLLMSLDGNLTAYSPEAYVTFRDLFIFP